MFSQAGCRPLVLYAYSCGHALVSHRRKKRSGGAFRGYPRRQPQALRSVAMNPPRELLCRLEAIVRDQAHRTLTDLSYSYGNRWCDQVRRLERIGPLAAGGSHERIRGSLPRQEHVEGCPEAIDIGTRIGPTHILLRGGVARRYLTNKGGGCFAVVFLGGAKINQHGFMAFRWNDDVPGFNVPVHDGWILTVQIDESIDNGCQQSQDQRER